MKPERWVRIDEIFAAALDRDESARGRFLDDACAADAALRAEVVTLLEMERASRAFLESPVFHSVTSVIGETPPLRGARERAIDGARFVPGDVVAGRYRIAGLLGRGGMGEVYRADDLRLGQPVALKFLAEALASDGAALARFHREVSLARQISHRHVCRVYDIGEHDGMHFLSMEYIRGEELSSLLRRIGRLPNAKGVEVARQLCGGLAAIHAARVLHRDLKPANIMLDEHGEVRITDFGIAVLAERVGEADGLIGTPAYMAPEQREGSEVTTRSDLYSLGVVLYELFTGKRPPANVRAVPDVDRRVERAIVRCLQRDPERRPPSALHVASSLPGGDPLAAALAAGETPSPQMVASAGSEGSLRPAVAATLLAAIVAGIASIAMYRGRAVSFVVVAPWQKELASVTASGKAFSIALLALYFGAIGLAALLAWRNIRAGRGDRHGAFVLALFTFVTRMAFWLFSAHHVPAIAYVVRGLIGGVQSALYWACLAGLLHLALEPYVRRRWPEWLISWSRLLAGGVRDPLVGRDVLIGGVFGVAAMVASELQSLVPQLVSGTMNTLSVNSPLAIDTGLLGARGFVPLLANQTSAAILFSFVILAVLSFVAMITRSRRVAVWGTWAVLSAALTLNVPDRSVAGVLLGLVVPTLLVMVIARYGVLALISTMFFMHLWAFYPVTTELTAWYATSFVMQLVVLAAIVAFAYRTSTAGQPLFRDELL
jgi:hypothetical protein